MIYPSDRQVLADLIRVLEKDADAEKAADRLLEGLDSVRRVYEMDTEDIIAKAGITRRTAEVIDFVDELSRRTAVDEQGEKPLLNTPETAGRYFEALMRGRHIEYCYMACLDKSGRMIKCRLLQKGTLDSSNIYVRDIAQEALRSGAAGVVLAHNHPGGTLKPSRADVDVTKAAAECLEIIGIKLIEHMIVTENGSIGLIGEGYLS